MLNILSLFPILREHNRLLEKRSILSFQSKASKLVVAFMFCFFFVYLLILTIFISLAANSSKGVIAYEFFYGITPFLFTIDFFFRFVFQQTPLQQVKPYMLLPVSKYSCIDFFIIQSLLSKGNIILLVSMFIPFAIMSVLFSEGFGIMCLFLLGLYIIELIVSQVYSIMRTLVNHNMLWWVFAIGMILLVFSPIFFDKDWNLTISFYHLLLSYSHFGSWICNGNILSWIVLLSILYFSIYCNRRIQYRMVYDELLQAEKTFKVGNSNKLSFLEKYNLVGEFLRLEILLIRRNKNVRKKFLSANVIVLLFSILCSFTSTYDEIGMIKFWIIYCFAIYGVMMLLRIMSYEGNYIERLMMGHSTIESLLKAKYYIYSLILLFPFILMLPMYFTGKASLLMLTSYMVFTAGVDNFLFMQLAVYNKQTDSLNQKITGKGVVENSWVMILIEFLAFALPIFIIKLLGIFISEDVAYIILFIIGMAFILSHNYWIRNIYKRLNARKYTNIESMMATRNQK